MVVSFSGAPAKAARNHKDMAMDYETTIDGNSKVLRFIANRMGSNPGGRLFGSILAIAWKRGCSIGLFDKISAPCPDAVCVLLVDHLDDLVAWAVDNHEVETAKRKRECDACFASYGRIQDGAA